MSTTVSIRQGSVDDLEDVRKVAQRAFTGPDAELESWLSFDAIGKAMEEAAGLCLVAEHNKHVVGGIYAQPESLVNGREGLDKWVIILLAVSPFIQGTGVGRGLIRELEQHVVAAGAKKIFVYTNATDERLISFYEGIGYRQVGTLEEYQYGVGNAATFLYKRLD